jgi:hypothetical protein
MVNFNTQRTAAAYSGPLIFLITTSLSHETPDSRVEILRCFMRSRRWLVMACNFKGPQRACVRTTVRHRGAMPGGRGHGIATDETAQSAARAWGLLDAKLKGEGLERPRSRRLQPATWWTSWRR